MKKNNTDFNLSKNVPESKNQYTYDGFLTARPGTRLVGWVISKNPITISKE